MAYVCDGVINGPIGVRGGQAGGVASQHVQGIDGSRRPLEQASVARISNGELLVCRTTGGGGYGNPMDRPTALVVKDVAEGWISVARAREVYGVAVGKDGQVDAAETKRLREPIAA